MPTSNSSSSRPGSSWSVTTRAQIAPTVCQATRTSRRTAVLSILVASHATRSSKSRVKPDSTLANGTPSVRTPWVGQSIRRSLALTTSRRRPRSRCRQLESTVRVSERALLEWEQSAQASRRRRSATVTVICAGSNETSRTVVPGRASKRLNAVVTRTGVGPPGWGLDTCNPTVWPVRVTHPGPSTSSAWSYQHLRVPRTPGAPTFSSGAPRRISGRWDAITTVPPTQTAPQDGAAHPLARIVDRLDQVHLPTRQGRRAWTNRRLDVLVLGPGAPLLAKQQASQDGFVVRHPDRVRGRRLLLVDDLLISGAHLQSSASALATAGATVAAVVVGRRLNVRQEYPRRLWDQLRREQADWRKAQRASSTGQRTLGDPRLAERQALAYFASCCLEDPRPHQPGLDVAIDP